MGRPETRRVAHDLLDEPRVTGQRVSVRQIRRLVEERDRSPEWVAEEFDLDLAAVYDALAYYHDHPEEMADVVAERAERWEGITDEIDRPSGVDPA